MYNINNKVYITPKVGTIVVALLHRQFFDAWEYAYCRSLSFMVRL